MLDIIYGNAAFDFVTAFNFEGTGNLLREMAAGDQQNFVSAYAAIKDATQAALDALIAFDED